MNKLFSNSFKLLFLAAIILGLFCCSKDNDANPAITDSDFQFTGEKIDVGLYIDHGVWDGTETTVTNMLKGIECTYTILTKDSILNCNLNRYRVILIPGGDMWEYVSYLTLNGMNKIKDFVSRGGGYFGICGGAYFGTNKITWRGWSGEPRKNISITGLNLGSVDSDGPIEDFAPSYKDVRCKVNIVGKDHTVARNVPNMIEVYYDHGPKFLINDSNISIIGSTVKGDKTTMIAFQYGEGRVFLTGQHPEMDDTHISWTLVKNAIKWCSNR
jgi:glutamine amidotransferase-like uncharacterized protein